MGEFPLGDCECGAVYASDPSGFNVGSVIVELLVHACGDNWDMAWDLLPEEDYLTGRIENYDEVTHQVVEKRNLDGRLIRGVLYFIRMQESVADLTSRFKEKGKSPAAKPGVSARKVQIEKALDPKREKKKANKNTAHSSKTKEVRLRPKTGKHDIDFKVNQAKKFLDNKDKVQITVQFRGREMAHIDEGRRVMDEVVKELAEHGKIEQSPVQHGRRMTCMIVPHR